MKIKERINKSVFTKFLILYYTFVFLFAVYFILQFLFAFILLYSKFNRSDNNYQTLIIHGSKVTIGNESYWLWNMPEFYIATIAGAIIAGLLTFAIIKFVCKKSPVTYLGLNPIRKPHLKWFLYSFLLLLSLSFLVEILELNWEADINPETTFQKIGMLLGFCVFGPFIEELLFRGYLLTRMNEILNGRLQIVTVIIVSLLFSTIHLQYDIYQMIIIFILSAFLCLMKLKTGNLWMPVIVHIMNNIIAFSAYL